MKLASIHVGDVYIVETRPHHPIKRQRQVTVSRITADGIEVTYPLLVPAPGTVPCRDCMKSVEITRTIVVQPNQVLRTLAEQALLNAEGQRRARMWDDVPGGVVPRNRHIPAPVVREEARLASAR